MRFFVAKTIYALYLSQKLFTHFICHENDLHTSSGKFLRIQSCHPESSDFLGLWMSWTTLHCSSSTCETETQSRRHANLGKPIIQDFLSPSTTDVPIIDHKLLSWFVEEWWCGGWIFIIMNPGEVVEYSRKLLCRNNWRALPLPLPDFDENLEKTNQKGLTMVYWH